MSENAQLLRTSRHCPPDHACDGALAGAGAGRLILQAETANLVGLAREAGDGATTERRERMRNQRMKRVVAIFNCLGLIIGALTSAGAFSLLDPHSWPQPFNPYDWPFTLIPIP